MFKEQTSSKLVEFTPKLLHSSKLCGVLHFYPNPPKFLHRYICHICNIQQLWRGEVAVGNLIVVFLQKVSDPVSDNHPIISTTMAALFHQYCRVRQLSPFWRFFLIGSVIWKKSVEFCCRQDQYTFFKVINSFLNQCWTRTMCLTRSHWGALVETGTPWSARNMNEKSSRFAKFYHL